MYIVFEKKEQYLHASRWLLQNKNNKLGTSLLRPMRETTSDA